MTEQGEADARALAVRLRQVHFSQVLSSPMLRARRTCELAGLAPDCKLDGDLQEWNYGDYEGRRSIDICRDRPDWSLWRDGCPNGESADQAASRVDRLLSRLGTLTGNVALFLHGHIGAALAIRWIGLPMTKGEHFPLHPAAIGILGSVPHHLQVRGILMWNAAPLGTAL